MRTDLGDADTTERRPPRRGGAGRSNVVLTVRNLCKGFDADGRVVPVLDDISLDVVRGAWLTLLGPSGCGKTTLLRALAGLIEPDSGRIEWARPSQQRLGVAAYLPQRDTLLPWRTALDNAVLAMEIAGRPRTASRARATALLGRFGLAGFERNYPSQLSGGMRQRLALIRTFLADRELLLLDEPLGALDPLTRVTLQDWLLTVWSDLHKTVVLVTHDVEEALVLSDTVVVLSARPARVCTAQDVDLQRPRSRNAAELVERKAELLGLLLGELS